MHNPKPQLDDLLPAYISHLGKLMFSPPNIIIHCQQSDWCSVSALTDRKICGDKNPGKKEKKGGKKERIAG